MEGARELLERTAAIAADYLSSLDDRPVFPDVTPGELREALGGRSTRSRSSSTWRRRPDAA